MVRAGAARAASCACALLVLLMAPRVAVGQPGGRLESAPAHRDAVRAEAYAGVAYAFATWQDAWNSGDVEALARVYHDDAVARLPGQAFVNGKRGLVTSLPDALSDHPRLLMTDLDFESDGVTASVVSRYAFERGAPPAGIVTSVLVLGRNGWRFRVQVFGDVVERASDPAGPPR